VAVPADERVATISWTSVVVGAWCVDQVELREAAVVRETFGAGAGCIVPPLTVAGDWNGAAVDVRMYLAGDGAGTPIVSDVSVTTALLPPAPPGGGGHPLPGLEELLRLDCSAIVAYVSCTLTLTEDIYPLDILSVTWTVDGRNVQGTHQGKEWRVGAWSLSAEARVTAAVVLTNRLDRADLSRDVPTHLGIVVLVGLIATGVVAGAVAARKRKEVGHGHGG